MISHLQIPRNSIMKTIVHFISKTLRHLRIHLVLRQQIEKMHLLDVRLFFVLMSNVCLSSFEVLSKCRVLLHYGVKLVRIFLIPQVIWKKLDALLTSSFFEMVFEVIAQCSIRVMSDQFNI